MVMGGELDEFWLKCHKAAFCLPMAFLAKAYEVVGLIGLYIVVILAFDITKGSEGDNVVNMEIVTKFAFVSMAALATIAVTLTNFATQMLPPRAIVQALFPLWDFSRFSLASHLPHLLAFTRTELAPSLCDFARNGGKECSALQAGAIEAGPERMPLAANVLGKPFTLANKIAEIPFCLVCYEFVLANRLTALSTNAINGVSLGATIVRAGALERTKLALPAIGLFPRKLLPAFLTRACNQHKNLLLAMTGCLSRAYRRQQEAIRTIAVCVLPVKPICPRQLDYTMTQE